MERLSVVLLVSLSVTRYLCISGIVGFGFSPEILKLGEHNECGQVATGDCRIMRLGKWDYLAGVNVKITVHHQPSRFGV